MKKIAQLMGFGLVACAASTLAVATACPTLAALKTVGFQKVEYDYVAVSAYSINPFGTNKQWGFSTFMSNDEAAAPQQALLSLSQALSDLHFVGSDEHYQGSQTLCAYSFAHGSRQALAISE